MSERTSSETSAAGAETTSAHEHRWRVVAYEHTGQLIGYRCRDCGAERLDRAEVGA